MVNRGVRVKLYDNRLDCEVYGVILPVKANDFVKYKLNTNNGWKFSWISHKANEVYKLVLDQDEDEILGLVSVIRFNKADSLYMAQIERREQNKRKSSRRYEGVGENLIAYVCRLAIMCDKAKGNVFFVAKEGARKVYIEKYGAIAFNERKSWLVFTPEISLNIEQKYLGWNRDDYEG